MANRVLARRGLRIGPILQPDLIRDGLAAHLEVCGRFSMTSPERLFAVAEATRYVTRAGIPGDFVECGVWRGGAALMMARVAADQGAGGRRIWLYDTFAGMAEPTDEDGDTARARWRQSDHGGASDWCSASLDEVKRNVEGNTTLGPERFEYVAGRVEDTIPGRVPDRIALLRLDTDWYRSTRHELQHLWPRLSPGGVLLVDDYGHWEGARRAVDEFFADKTILMHRTDETGRAIQKV